MYSHYVRYHSLAVLNEEIDTAETETTLLITDLEHQEINTTYFAENNEKVTLAVQTADRIIELYSSEDSGSTFNYLDEINYEDAEYFFMKELYMNNSDQLYFAGRNFNVYEVHKYDAVTSDYIEIYEGLYPYETCDFSLTEDGERVLGRLSPRDDIAEYITLQYSLYNDQLNSTVFWEPQILDNIINKDLSELTIVFDDSDSLYVLLNANFEDEYNRNLYMIKGFINGVTPETEDEIPLAEMTLRIYPNPFNPTTNITFSLIETNTKNAKLELFNLRGQKIRSFDCHTACRGEAGRSPELVDVGNSQNHYSVTWDGTDEKDQHVGSGVYFARLKAGKNILLKKMVLIK